MGFIILLMGVIKAHEMELANRLAVLAAVTGAAVSQYDSGLEECPALRCVVSFQT